MSGSANERMPMSDFFEMLKKVAPELFKSEMGFRNELLRGVPFAARSRFDWSEVGDVPKWVAGRARGIGGGRRRTGAGAIESDRERVSFLFWTTNGQQMYTSPTQIGLVDRVELVRKDDTRIVLNRTPFVPRGGEERAEPTMYSLGTEQRVSIYPAPDDAYRVLVYARRLSASEERIAAGLREQVAERARYGGRTREEFERAANAIRADQERELQEAGLPISMWSTPLAQELPPRERDLEAEERESLEERAARLQRETLDYVKEYAGFPKERDRVDALVYGVRTARFNAADYEKVVIKTYGDEMFVSKDATYVREPESAPRTIPELEPRRRRVQVRKP